MITSTFSLIGSLVGPILIIIFSKIFSDNTDDWDPKKLAQFIYIGVFLHLIPVTCMFFYKDISTVQEDTESSLEQGLITESTESSTESLPKEDGPFFTFVPTILFIAELVIVTGSGMTVKFWPLFLKDECNLSMQTIQILLIIVILEIILFQYLAQIIAKKCGRIYTVFMLNIMGIIAQTILGLLPSYDNQWLIGFLYTFRFSIMNSAGPLMNSALMDIVPKNHRARWESLYSIITLGWCGSSFLGGFINDKMDYSSTFLITSGCHFIGNCIYLLIRNSIPDEKDDI